MDADERRGRLNEISGRVIGCAFAVANALGCGFLEKMHENALAHELRKAGLRTAQQHAISVRYDGTAGVLAGPGIPGIIDLGPITLP